MRIFRLLICVSGFLMCMACSNHKDQSSKFKDQSYVSPIDYEIVLAGNFGEPRPWHFHGGIDIKTGNQEGKKIFSVAEGYVSHLTVNKHGFGNAIYVAHPDGMTSVYCHLRRFADVYEQQLQRTGRRDTLEVRFAPGQFPVKAGELIAISGNTGNSTGPHLHLELHDTHSWVMRDPMLKLAHLIADSVAPQAHSFMAVPMDGEGLFNGGFTKQTFGFGAPDVKVKNLKFNVKREFTAWGRVGFALWADDYSEATYNHYGIRSTRLLVDGREVFRSDVDSIPVSCQPEVNVWGDYYHWRRNHVWYMKSYCEKGIRLPILHTGFDRGIVCFDQERPYHLTYILRDYNGNQSEYNFTVHGQRDSRVTPRRRWTLLDTYQLYDQCLWPLHTRKTI